MKISAFNDSMNLCTACGAVNTMTLDRENGEYLCTGCGAISNEGTQIMQQEFEQMKSSYQKASTLNDHNSGNGMYNSVTIQVDYVSKKNPGLAFILNDRRVKDFGGKKVEKQLADPYQAMLFAGKDWHVEIDHVTGRKEFKWSRYDAPTLRLIKEYGEQLCTKFHLDTVQKTHIAAEVKRLFSQLIMSEMTHWIVYSAIRKYDHFLSDNDLAEVEAEIRALTEGIALKVRTRCDKELIKMLKEPLKVTA